MRALALGAEMFIMTITTTVAPMGETSTLTSGTRILDAAPIRETATRNGAEAQMIMQGRTTLGVVDAVVRTTQATETGVASMIMKRLGVALGLT